MSTFNTRCDRFETLKKVRGRKPLFFDMSIWIELERGYSDAAKHTLSLLRQGVAQRRLFCPFQYTTIWELYKQDQASRERLAALIEELSLNVAFAICDDVFRWECEDLVSGLLNEQPTKISDLLFVPPAYYLSDSEQWTFSENGLPEDEQAEMVRRVQQGKEGLTLTELVKLVGPSIQNAPHPNIPYQTMAQEARAASGDKAKRHRRSAADCVNRVVVSFFYKLPEPRKTRACRALEAKVAGADGSRMGFVLELLPAIRNHAEVLAGRIDDTGRKDDPNDFYDLNSLPVPLAYAHAIVFRDKMIRNLVRKRSDLLTQNPRCSFFDDLPGFATYLEQQKNEENVGV